MECLATYTRQRDAGCMCTGAHMDTPPFPYMRFTQYLCWSERYDMRFDCNYTGGRALCGLCYRIDEDRSAGAGTLGHRAGRAEWAGVQGASAGGHVNRFLSPWTHMINNLPKPRVRIQPAGEVDIP